MMGLRSGLFAFVLVCCVFGSTNGQPDIDYAKKSAYARAATECRTIVKYIGSVDGVGVIPFSKEDPDKVSGFLKKLDISIDADFEFIQSRDDSIARAMAKIIRPGDKVNANDDEYKALLVALWLEWRAPRHGKITQAQGLGLAVASLDKFARVKFKSDPAKASVFIDGIYRGQTHCVLYLSCEGKYEVKLAKDGYMPQVKHPYVPTGRNDLVEEMLKKLL